MALQVELTNAFQPEAEQHLLSLCLLEVGSQLFGIDTCKIREVLGKRAVDRVPLAPAFIGGVVAYRGDVLTTVSARALLGLRALEGQGCVLVLETDQTQEEPERFGLIVDNVGGVVTVDGRLRADNPSTLDEVGRALFCGAFRSEHGLLVQLDPERLKPMKLAASGLFAHAQRERTLPGDDPHASGQAAHTAEPDKSNALQGPTGIA
jgi:purine-binding chemotaxis protein CheW